MQGLDAAFFHAETPTMHLHVVGVMVLDPSDAREPWGYDTVVRLLRERIHLLPPLRWRPVPTPAALDGPRWIEAPDFDVADHVHRATLPEPAGLAELARFAARTASAPLRRDRPLWEMHVVEHLGDGSVALVAKLHHSFMDGGAGSDVMSSLFDLSPEGDEVAGPSEAWRSDAVPGAPRLLLESVGGAASRLASVPGVLARTTLGLARSVPVARARRAPSSGLVGPATPLNGSLTPERVVAFARCSLDDVKRTRAAFGVTVNDVVLAAATAALRSELLDRDALPDRPLVAMVPVSERAEGETEFSNRTTAMSVGLPVQLADPVERLHAVHDLALDAKDRHRAKGEGFLEGWLSLLPPLLVQAGAGAYTGSGVARFLPPVFNVIVSNIPGPPVPLYLAGAKVTHLYPMGPLFEGSGLNLTLLSQGDVVDIGVIACPAMVDDPDRVATRVIEGLQELAARAGAEQPAPVGRHASPAAS